MRWLNRIKSKIEEKIPSLLYGESKYWVTFKNSETNRNVVYLQLLKNEIRLFTIFNFEWEKMKSSQFLIRSEDSIDEAVELIIHSYKEDIIK